MVFYFLITSLSKTYKKKKIVNTFYFLIVIIFLSEHIIRAMLKVPACFLFFDKYANKQNVEYEFESLFNSK